MIVLEVNGSKRTVDVHPDTPLLWVLREQLRMTGTKYGCGMALCGACTVHLDGDAVRSCMVPVREAEGRKVDTIEGSSDLLRTVQAAWVAENVPQCGYCQSGQIMSAVALLKAKPTPTDEDIDSAMSGNICRCGMYQRIRRGIHRAAKALAK